MEEVKGGMSETRSVCPDENKEVVRPVRGWCTANVKELDTINVSVVHRI